MYKRKKTCTQCGKKKSIDDFYRYNKTTRTLSECKECSKRRTAEYKRKHSEENKKSSREYYQQHKEQCKNYLKINKERNRINVMLWRYRKKAKEHNLLQEKKGIRDYNKPMESKISEILSLRKILIANGVKLAVFRAQYLLDIIKKK